MAVRFLDDEKVPSRVRFLDGPETNAPQVSSGMLDAVRRVPGLLEKLSPIVPGLAEMSGIARPSELLSTAKSIREGLPKAGGAIAEKLGEIGVPAPISAAIATPVAIAPEIGSAALGIGEVAGIAGLGRGALSRAIRTTPEAMRPAFEAGKKAAGISGDLPVRRGAISRFPSLSGKTSVQPPPQAPLVSPASYPRDKESFINFANARVRAFKDKLSAQELDDYKTIITDMFRQGEVRKGTPQYALATDLIKRVTALHNKAIPGREELNRIYQLSRNIRLKGSREELGNFVKKYGKAAIAQALAIGGGGLILKRIFQP